MDELPEQPDGIEEDSLDLPTPENAVTRVAEFLRAWGDGLIKVVGSTPLYSRDLEVLSKLPVVLAEVQAEVERVAFRVRTEFTKSAAEARAELATITEQRAELEAQSLGYYRQWINTRDQVATLRRELEEATADRAALRNQLAQTIGQREVLADFARLVAHNDTRRSVTLLLAAKDALAVLGPDPAKAGDRIRIKPSVGTFNSQDATIVEVRDNGMFAARTDLDNPQWAPLLFRRHEFDIVRAAKAPAEPEAQ